MTSAPVGMAFGKIAFPASSRSHSSFGRDCFHFGDAGLNPLVNDRNLCAKSPTSRKPARVGHAIDGNDAIVPLVDRGVFGNRGPAAVFGFVSSARVKTVNRMAQGRTFAHVLQERHERLSPPFAHFDADCSVSRVVLEPRVLASPLHPNPNAIGRAPLSAAFMTVNPSLRHVNWIHEARENSKVLS